MITLGPSLVYVIWSYDPLQEGVATSSSGSTDA